MSDFADNLCTDMCCTLIFFFLLGSVTFPQSHNGADFTFLSKKRRMTECSRYLLVVGK